MAAFQAVILDMDGLLIDSEPFWQQAEMEVFGSVGLQLTHQMCLQTKGLRIDEVVAYWHQRHPWTGASETEIADRIVARVIELVRLEGKAKVGVTQLEEFLQTLGLPVALASSSAYSLIDAVVDRLELGRLLQFVYSATEEDYGKPHPGVYITTARKLGLAPTACVALEDSLNGVLAAKAARMCCLAVPEDYPEQAPGFAIADRVLASLLEVTPQLWEELEMQSDGGR